MENGFCAARCSFYLVSFFRSPRSRKPRRRQLRPTFGKTEFELQQSRLLAGLRQATDEPDSYLQLLQVKVAYVGHPYLNQPEGTPESVAKLTAEDLRAYNQKIMQTSRLLLVIVGD